MWATWSAEAIYHAGDQYARLFREPLEGHHPDVLDAAYARWATSSAITALDLCAAALARAPAGWEDDRNVDLRRFYRGKLGDRLIDRVPNPVKEWLHGVVDDSVYKTVLDARNPFVHGVLSRHISVTIGHPHEPRPGRVAFRTETGQYSTRELIGMSQTVATAHIEVLLAGLVDGHL